MQLALPSNACRSTSLLVVAETCCMAMCCPRPALLISPLCMPEILNRKPGKINHGDPIRASSALCPAEVCQLRHFVAWRRHACF